MVYSAKTEMAEMPKNNDTIFMKANRGRAVANFRAVGIEFRSASARLTVSFKSHSETARFSRTLKVW
jgi:hypothetical protein